MNRFDIVLGHYVYCSLHHGGQWSPLYARLCRIMSYFDPGPMFSETRFFEDDDYAEAREVYESLAGTSP